MTKEKKVNYIVATIIVYNFLCENKKFLHFSFRLVYSIKIVTNRSKDFIWLAKRSNKSFKFYGIFTVNMSSRGDGTIGYNLRGYFQFNDLSQQ